MNFKTPKFWHKRMSILSILLIPLSWLYRLGHVINMKRQPPPYHAKIPVICIGNAIAGGSGKTPSVIALVKLIKENNIAQNPFILTRGYGRKTKTPILVDLNKHHANDVGDEALLLGQHSPTIVSSNRADGAKLAEEIGADIIIMDDGLQNNHLHKNINFLVVDRQIDFGNNRVLPAGPLREPLSSILPKIHAILCIGRPFHSDKAVFQSFILPQDGLDLNKNYVAFAGLGYPEKFKNTLLDLKAKLVGWHTFPDHHSYSEQELEDMQDDALNKQAVLITTEKDYARLPESWKKKIINFPIELQFKSPNDIVQFLELGLGAIA
ncbi:MAG: tetraacyldisaccharide 4'-kinase [Alphaproteobacteria bacterium]|nr:tetraacyldisaccharide 4'-kinase [Alphaproteobacteria bacterium]